MKTKKKKASLTALSNNEIKNLGSMLIGFQMKLDNFQADMEDIEDELVLAEKIQEELRYNAEFLKKPQIISSFKLYKQTLKDLPDIRDQILNIISKKRKLISLIKKTEKAYEYYFKQYETLMAISEPKVLEFKKNGQRSSKNKDK